MIQGIIVGHRDIGEGFLRALESIAGSREHILFLSNDGLSTNDLADEIRKVAAGSAHEGTIIFVDAYGGSCWRAAKLARVSRCRIISGLNLPMLLSFMNKRETVSFDEFPDVMVTDGKRGIKTE